MSLSATNPMRNMEVSFETIDRESQRMLEAVASARPALGDGAGSDITQQWGAGCVKMDGSDALPIHERREAEEIDEDYAGWTEHTTGFGVKMMLKMGFMGACGKDEQGPVKPYLPRRNSQFVKIGVGFDYPDEGPRPPPKKLRIFRDRYHGYCNVCNTTFTCVEAHRAHLNGKRHRRNLTKLRRSGYFVPPHALNGSVPIPGWSKPPPKFGPGHGGTTVSFAPPASEVAGAPTRKVTVVPVTAVPKGQTNLAAQPLVTRGQESRNRNANRSNVAPPPGLVPQGQAAAFKPHYNPGQAPPAMYFQEWNQTHVQTDLFDHKGAVSQNARRVQNDEDTFVVQAQTAGQTSLEAIHMNLPKDGGSLWERLRLLDPEVSLDDYFADEKWDTEALKADIILTIKKNKEDWSESDLANDIRVKLMQKLPLAGSKMSQEKKQKVDAAAAQRASHSIGGAGTGGDSNAASKGADPSSWFASLAKAEMKWTVGGGPDKNANSDSDDSDLDDDDDDDADMQDANGAPIDNDDDDDEPPPPEPESSVPPPPGLKAPNLSEYASLLEGGDDDDIVVTAADMASGHNFQPQYPICGPRVFSHHANVPPAHKGTCARQMAIEAKVLQLYAPPDASVVQTSRLWRGLVRKILTNLKAKLYQYSSLKAKHRSIAQSNKQMEAEYDSMKAQYDTMHANYTVFYKDFAKKEKEKASLQDKIDELTATISGLNNKIGRQASQMAILKAQKTVDLNTADGRRARKREDTIQDLKDKIRKIDDDRKGVKAEMRKKYDKKLRKLEEFLGEKFAVELERMEKKLDAKRTELREQKSVFEDKIAALHKQAIQTNGHHQPIVLDGADQKPLVDTKVEAHKKPSSSSSSVLDALAHSDSEMDKVEFESVDSDGESAAPAACLPFNRHLQHLQKDTAEKGSLIETLQSQLRAATQGTLFEDTSAELRQLRTKVETLQRVNKKLRTSSVESSERIADLETKSEKPADWQTKEKVLHKLVELNKTLSNTVKEQDLKLKILDRKSARDAELSEANTALSAQVESLQGEQSKLQKRLKRKREELEAQTAKAVTLAGKVLDMHQQNKKRRTSDKDGEATSDKRVTRSSKSSTSSSSSSSSSRKKRK